MVTPCVGATPIFRAGRAIGDDSAEETNCDRTGDGDDGGVDGGVRVLLRPRDVDRARDRDGVRSTRLGDSGLTDRWGWRSLARVGLVARDFS